MMPRFRMKSTGSLVDVSDEQAKVLARHLEPVKVAKRPASAAAKKHQK